MYRPTTIPTPEQIERTAHLQELADQQHTAAAFTGVAWDNVTADFMAWYQGRVLGWAPTAIGAQQIVISQRGRDVAHGHRVPTYQARAPRSQARRPA